MLVQGPESLVRIYSISNLQEISTLQPAFKLGVSALCLSGDGLRVALCSQEPDLQVTVYNRETVSS